MPTIHLTTFIEAPVRRVFDLSRNITLHKKTMEKSGEKAIAGVTSGLINLNETVTWQAKHLFKTRIFKSRISAMEPYTFFQDEMVSGDFRSVRHEHHFKTIANGTIMIDFFHFESPYGSLGMIANKLLLTRYLRNLLENRNRIIKEYAETNKWKGILEEEVVSKGH
jgi:ligand-binding SRPBCC domain-containing protein